MVTTRGGVILLMPELGILAGELIIG